MGHESMLRTKHRLIISLKDRMNRRNCPLHRIASRPHLLKLCVMEKLIV
ncbi:MAG: hypothetical protein ACLPWD_07515 [Methanobacterium sp.]